MYSFFPTKWTLSLHSLDNLFDLRRYSISFHLNFYSIICSKEQEKLFLQNTKCRYNFLILLLEGQIFQYIAKSDVDKNLVCAIAWIRYSCLPLSLYDKKVRDFIIFLAQK